MNTTSTAIALLSVFVLLAACGADETSPLLSAELDGIGVPAIDFSEIESNQASVVVFIAPDCPLTINHTLTLNTTAGEFKDSGIEFYGVVAGNWYSDDEIQTFQETYRLQFPIAVDREYRVTDYFGARVTPEVFVVDSGGELLYAGAIDNWVGELGQHRTVTTEHYLRDALEDIAGGSAVEVEAVQAAGCFIEREG